ncbi:MAG: cardiolipin synthase [Candidatus Cloacimonadales bacterium]
MKRAILVVLIILIIALAVGYYLISLESEINRQKIWSAVSVGVNIIFALTIITVIFTVVMGNNEPIFTIAWLQILIFLPVVGFILFLMFGINYRKRKMFRKKADLDLSQLKNFRSLLHQQKSLKFHDFKIENLTQSHIVKLLYRNNHSFLTINNQVQTYHDGATTNRQIFEQLQQAQAHIHLEYFSINNDQTGLELQKILIAKAKAGVEVRLIYDAVGCWKLRKKYLQPLRDSGVQAIAFLPVTLPVLSSKLNFRNHRKICIVDGKIGFIGGVNIGDKYMGASKRFGYWRDSHLQLQGDCVYSLQKSFLIDWNFLSNEKIRLEKYFPKHNIQNLLPLQFAISGPDSQWENILQLYFSAITQAQKRVYITTPYLVLNESILTALTTAALSGVDVRIILPHKADHLVVFLGSHSYYKELLAAGVRIYHYQRGFVHAKVLLVDDEFVSVGSANMDIRSFKQNFEINAIIYDQDYSQKMIEQFQADISYSSEIILSEFEKRNFWHKSGESIARLVSPLL